LFDASVIGVESVPEGDENKTRHNDKNRNSHSGIDSYALNKFLLF